MPCSDNFTDEQERQKVVKALDERTDMLCRLCRHLEYHLEDNHFAFRSIPEDIKAWFEKHKQFDKSEGR